MPFVENNAASTPSSLPPNGPAGGDLSGTYPNPGVVATLFQAQIPNLVASVTGLFIPTQSVVFPSANDMRLTRVIVPRTGTLHDVAIWVQTSSGNISWAVYDTGDASAGTYTRLATSGTVACPSGGSYQVYDPSLAVTRGQELLLALSCDNTTAAFGAGTVATGAQQQLPPGFLPVSGGALPKVAGRVNTAHPAPTSFAEASFITSGAGGISIMFARVA